MLYGGLHVGHTRSSHSDGACREDLQSGFGILYLVSDSWVKLWLVGSFFESLRERDNFDGKGESAGAENIDDPPVLDTNIFVFIIQLLENPREFPSADLSLVFTVSSGAGDLSGTPDGSCRVRMPGMLRFSLKIELTGQTLPQLHGNHPVLFPVLHVGAIQGNLLQIEMTTDAKTTHDVVDDDIDLRLRFLFNFLLGSVGVINFLFGLYCWHGCH